MLTEASEKQPPGGFIYPGRVESLESDPPSLSFVGELLIHGILLSLNLEEEGLHTALKTYVDAII